MQYIACNIFFKVSKSSKVHYLLPNHFRTPRTSHTNIETPLPGAKQTSFCSLKKHTSSPFAQQAPWVRPVLAVAGSRLAASKNANTGATAFECTNPGRHLCQEKQRKLPVLWTRHPEADDVSRIWGKEARAEPSWRWYSENTLMWKKRRNISEKCVLALLLKGALCRHVTKCGGWSMVFHSTSRVPQAESGSQCGFRRQNWWPGPRSSVKT